MKFPLTSGGKTNRAYFTNGESTSPSLCERYHKTTFFLTISKKVDSTTSRIGEENPQKYFDITDLPTYRKTQLQ